jgi:hypothetical protein
MTYRKSPPKNQQAVFNLSDNQKFLIGNALRITGIIGLLASLVVIFATGNIFWGVLVLVVMSYFTLPIVPIVLLIIGQRLVSKSKVKYKI